MEILMLISLIEILTLSADPYQFIIKIALTDENELKRIKCR